jgi:hypothetical protein
MDVARMPEPGATEGPSRQDLLRIYEQTKVSRCRMDLDCRSARIPTP